MPRECYDFNGIDIPINHFARCCVPAGVPVDLKLQGPLAYYARAPRGRKHPDEDCIEIFCGYYCFENPIVVHYEIPAECHDPDTLLIVRDVKTWMTHDREDYEVQDVPHVEFDVKNPGTWDDRTEALEELRLTGKAPRISRPMAPQPEDREWRYEKRDNRDDRDDRRRSRHASRAVEDRDDGRRSLYSGLPRESGGHSRRHSRAPDEDRRRGSRVAYQFQGYEEDVDELTAGAGRLSMGGGGETSSRSSRGGRSSRKDGPPTSSSKYFGREDPEEARGSSRRRESSSRARESSRARGESTSSRAAVTKRDDPFKSYWSPSDGLREWWPIREDYTVGDFMHQRRLRDGVSRPDWEEFEQSYARSLFSRKYFERELLRNYYDGLEPVMSKGKLVDFRDPRALRRRH